MFYINKSDKHLLNGSALSKTERVVQDCLTKVWIQRSIEIFSVSSPKYWMPLDNLQLYIYVHVCQEDKYNNVSHLVNCDPVACDKVDSS